MAQQRPRGPIGVFDSGYGGLTILDDLQRQLPDNDYLYLGDNAHAPYGGRAPQAVIEYTRRAVEVLFAQGCPLVIVACNTAAATALRHLQQTMPSVLDGTHRLLGIIRPTAEMIGTVSQTQHIGLLGTPRTVDSKTYEEEIAHFFPTLTVSAHPCTLWAALVEAGEDNSQGTEYFVRKDLTALLDKDPAIDAILLACTHYPLLLPLIRRATPENITIVCQGPIVAKSLEQYLARHKEIADSCTHGATTTFLTTDDPALFAANAAHFLHTPLPSLPLPLPL